jgi:lysozyme
MEDVKKWIKSDEKLKTHLYKDNMDKWTIGFGRNIEDNGISPEEANFLFENDFARCQKELSPYPWFVNQPENVQAALLNMCFNLGIPKLLGFRKMIVALTCKDYNKAAMECLDSKWAIQVGDRAKRVSLMIRQGF